MVRLVQNDDPRVPCPADNLAYCIARLRSLEGCDILGIGLVGPLLQAGWVHPLIERRTKLLPILKKGIVCSFAERQIVARLEVTEKGLDLPHERAGAWRSRWCGRSECWRCRSR